MPSSHKGLLCFSRTLPVDEAQPKLYCFAYAGGSGSIYAPWARTLAGTVTVLGVELPGHGSRFQENPFDNVAAMALDAADAIEASSGTSPFAFYGHSLGALVAFETARVLQGSGASLEQSPQHLFVGAARAPQLPRAMPPVSGLPDEGFLQAVQQRYGGLPAALFEEPELLELVLPVLRADFQAYEQYAYQGQAPLACPATAFHGTHDAVVSAAAAAAWSQVTTGRFRGVAVEGDHFFLNTCRDVLLERIRLSFEEAGKAIPVMFASHRSNNE